MKKLFNTKFLSAVLATLLMLALASCAAAPNEEGGVDLFPELNDPNYSAPGASGGNVQNGVPGETNATVADDAEMEAGDVEFDVEYATPDVPSLTCPRSSLPYLLKTLLLIPLSRTPLPSRQTLIPRHTPTSASWLKRDTASKI